MYKERSYPYFHLYPIQLNDFNQFEKVSIYSQKNSNCFIIPSREAITKKGNEKGKGLSKRAR